MKGNNVTTSVFLSETERLFFVLMFGGRCGIRKTENLLIIMSECFVNTVRLVFFTSNRRKGSSNF